MGILAADGVRQLAGYYKNFLNRAEGALRMEPPEDVVSPSLQVYTFVQVTGRIMCRTIADEETNATPKKKSAGQAGLQTPGSSKTKGSSPAAAKGKAAPKAAPKDMKVAPEAEADDGQEEDEELEDTDDDDDANDDEQPDDAVAELSMLDKIVGAASAKGKKDGKAKGAKKDGKKDGKKDSKAKDGQKGGKKDKK